jgi:hypothetical protein
MTEFKITDLRETEDWCMRFIGPRMYYLHNRIGGQGWTIKKQQSSPTVTIEDDKQALIAMLKFGK